MKSLQINVYGKVQKVGFRMHTQRKAIELGIKGIVENNPAGYVHIEAEGTAAALEAFTEWCKQGPPLAEVSHIETAAIDWQGFSGFGGRR